MNILLRRQEAISSYSRKSPVFLPNINITFLLLSSPVKLILLSCIDEIQHLKIVKEDKRPYDVAVTTLDVSSGLTSVICYLYEFTSLVHNSHQYTLEFTCLNLKSISRSHMVDRGSVVETVHIVCGQT